MNTDQIETILRGAPAPKAPPGLKAQLLNNAPKHSAVNMSDRDNAHWRGDRPASSWLRRWWPVLIPGTASLAFAAIISTQQMEIRKLQASIAEQANAAVPQSAPVAEVAPVTPGPVSASATAEVDEIARLKGEIARLNADIQRLEQTKAKNDNLKRQLTSTGGLTAQELQAGQDQKEKVQTIQCINNMKQLGLAVRFWANDHAETGPASVLDMTNEMVTPKILFCPADTTRQAATNWANFSSANSSYEFLAAGAQTQEPNRIMFRCTVHGSITLMDGSVQSQVLKSHPDWVVQRQGVLFFDPNAASAKQ